MTKSTNDEIQTESLTDNQMHTENTSLPLEDTNNKIDKTADNTTEKAADKPTDKPLHFTDNMQIRTCEQPKWFILRSFPGQEQRAVNQLHRQLTMYDLIDTLVEIFTPKEHVIALEKNKTQHKEQNFYPGYIFVAFDIKQDTEIHNIARLLLKDKTSFCQVSDLEIQRMKGLVNKSVQAPTTAMNLNIGQHVRVTDGSYINMTGRVDKIDIESKKIIVKLEIFGREVAVELDIDQVKTESEYN